VFSRGTGLTAIAAFATCAMACSPSSPQDTTAYRPVEPPFYVVPPIAVAPTWDATTSDSGDASSADAETGVDPQASDAALDGNTDGDAALDGADAPAGDASPLELDAAADAPVDADR
jgi:hypothetical protein